MDPTSWLPSPIVDLDVEALEPDLVLPDWDPRAEIIRRSEADMADWRAKDQRRREALKKEFRDRRRPL